MTTHDAGSEPQCHGIVGIEILGGHSALAERIEGHIELKARGRIRDLHVICFDGGVILTGRSRTYHGKQLAQEAALDLTQSPSVLANQIVVVC